MSHVVCPACQAYLGLAGATAESCPRCSAPLSARGAPAAWDGRDGASDRGRLAAAVERGRTILTAVTVVMIALVLFPVGADVLNGRLRGQDVLNVPLTAWLLWKTWGGSGWARWFLVVGTLLGTVVLIAVLFLLPGNIRPEAQLLLIGLVGVMLVSMIALASPSVGVYQTVQRGLRDGGRQ